MLSLMLKYKKVGRLVVGKYNCECQEKTHKRTFGISQ